MICVLLVGLHGWVGLCDPMVWSCNSEIRACSPCLQHYADPGDRPGCPKGFIPDEELSEVNKPPCPSMLAVATRSPIPYAIPIIANNSIALIAMFYILCFCLWDEL